MPIVIKHGDTLGNAGAILAQSLSAAEERANKRRMQWQELKVRGAIASTQAQAQITATETKAKAQLQEAAMKGGFAKDMQREEFHNALQMERQKGKAAAQNYEYKITADQRIEDARYAKAEKAVQNSPHMDDNQKAISLERLAVERATGANPTEVLGRAKQPVPEGQEPGKMHGSDETGWYMYNNEGEPKLMVRSDQTVSYMERKAELAKEATDVEALNNRKMKAAEKRADLLNERQQASKTGMLTEDDFSQVNDIIVQSYGEEVLSAEERALRNSVGVSSIGQPVGGPGTPEPHWSIDASRRGLIVHPEDMGLPRKIGESVAYMRKIRKDFGPDPKTYPPEFKRLYSLAAKPVREWEEEQERLKRGNQ
jgi:hypothetical protein